MDLMKREKGMVHVRNIIPMETYIGGEIMLMVKLVVYLRDIGTMENYGIR
jgi:hypothetical protein